MRKLQALLIVLLMSACAFAQTNVVSISPAAGVPVNGNGEVDLAQVNDGDTICFDISFTDIDFNFAGYEFEIDYPAYLMAASTTDADWQAGTGNSYRPGAFVTGATQYLPADVSGNRTAGTVSNTTGVLRVGMLWTNPADRPQGSTGTPNPGGVIGTMCFEYNPNATAHCTSLKESVRVILNVNAGENNDIFADDAATRVAVVTSNPSDDNGRPGLAAHMSEAGVPLRGDADKDGDRDAVDALFALRCIILGKNDANCPYINDTQTDFNTAFDYDCNGSVQAQDALGMLRLTVGVGNRPPAKNLDFYDLSSKQGSFVVSSDLQASMANVSYVFEGVKLLEPTISDAAKKQGWYLAYELSGDELSYILVNPNRKMVNVPNVTINYENASAQARIAMLGTEHQLTDGSLIAYSPLIEDRVGRDGSALEAQNK